ncbi:Gag-Pol polyprotein [Gossypium australe]|uniref:Gag-Pol polyprotein n=1 Tax=Gossypium australe TaxID=47621 RepID=A0A5B6WNH9_9ROSI|nr:Gag-Pol polyprotein [Gossypium australe]
MPQGAETVRIGKPPVDKIRKYGAEEFRATANDDPKRAEFWLENTIRIEFRKKYISQIFLDQKKKEFLELKQESMTVYEYEREFVRLSKYARERVPTKADIGLNENIKLIGILELREFAVLADRAYKAEELSKEKKQAEKEKYHNHFTASVGYSGKERGSQRSNLRSLSPSVTSVGSVGSPKPRCKYCNKLHFGECRIRSGACFRCGSFDRHLRDCLEKPVKDTIQTSRPSNPVSRGKPPRHPGNVSGSRRVTKDSTDKSEARASAMTYAIRAKEDAFAPDVITGTFSLLDTDITTLIDPSSTHSYIFTNLVYVKNLPVEFIEFVVKVSNP